MKKISSLQILMLMTLALGSSLVQAKEAGSQSGKCKNSVQSDKAVSMKSIEHRLREIKQNFEKNNNKAEALKALKAVEAEIKIFIADFKAREKHGKMWETHEHTLNRKVKNLHDFISKKS